MNNVSLVGRLAREPEIRRTSEGLAIATFTVAVNRARKDDGADFISCKAFRNTAEILEQYFHKGKEIAMTGRISTGSYEKDGRTIYTTDVIADRIFFVGSKDSTAKAESQPSNDFTGFVAMDDLPF